MISLKNTIICTILVYVTISSCVNPPDYPDEPVIGFIGMTNNTMNQGFGLDGEDYTEITFSFQDGDGDLGDTIANVFLVDKRDGVQSHSFTVDVIPPQGAANGISGEITIKVPTTCCISDNTPVPCQPDPIDPVDTIVYEIRINDRAGNESNMVETSPIYLQCN